MAGKLPKLNEWACDRTNECEAAFEKLALSEGYTVMKKGWPDFLCEKDGEYVVVEVKPKTKKGRMCYLHYEQLLVMMFLTRLGVECFVSDGETSEPFSVSEHASNKSLRRLGLADRNGKSDT